jgi:hypothetical protein
MEFSEVVAEKENLEREILKFIQNKTAEFEQKTGVMIDDLELYMVDVGRLGGLPRKALTKVRALIYL